MYYKEKIEDGVLYFKTHPDEDWKRAEYDQVVENYKKLKLQRRKEQKQVEEIRQQLSHAQNIIDGLVEHELLR